MRCSRSYDRKRAPTWSSCMSGCWPGPTAKAFGMPIVLSTVGVEYGFNGPTLPSILSELDGIEPIDRSSMNAFEYQPFRQAVQATGRKRLIIGGTPHRHRTAGARRRGSARITVIR